MKKKWEASLDEVTGQTNLDRAISLLCQEVRRLEIERARMLELIDELKKLAIPDTKP